MKNKIFLPALVFFTAVAIAGALKIGLVNAALLPATGWIWGGSEDSTAPPAGNMGVLDSNETGIGWVSMNSANTGSGGGSYSVNIPSEPGPVVGFAWSSNLRSYIDFAPHMSCPSASYAGKCDPYPANGGQQTDVMRVGDQLKGWARIVNIAVAKANGNSGGEDGWISLDPTAANSGITINSDGTLSGYGWAGATLGAMNFNNVKIPVPPVLTLSASPHIYLEAGETFTANSKKVNVSWTASSDKLASCTRTCTNGSGVNMDCIGWSGNNSIAESGSVDVALPALDVIFKMTCRDENTLEKTVIAEVRVGCSVGICNASTQKCDAHQGAFHIVTSGDDAVCKGGCITDADCVDRKGINWREVAP